MKKYKKCYCTEPLLADGTCRFKCPPELRKPGARALQVRAAVRRREHAASKSSTLLGAREAREGVVKALPPRLLYTGCEDFVARVAR